MAVNLTKIYTKTGDKGFTRLVGGVKIHKGDERLECYGTVDELNSCIGVVRTLAETSEGILQDESAQVLPQIQNELFDIGSVLATPVEEDNSGKDRIGSKQIQESQIELLESKMDAMLEGLEPLKSFTLPGGSSLNAHAHVARTVCRRLERLLWRVHETQAIDESILKYINRLSDFLFVYSRWAAKHEGKKEFLWVPGKK